MTEAELALIQAFILKQTGIVLTPEKRYLVESRLDPIVRHFKLSSLSEVAHKIGSIHRELDNAVIDAMTTNETLFFRDRQPFDLLRQQLLPKLIGARREEKRIRIWCAACSSGQEPYSIAMILDDMKAELNGFQVEILATDISERILNQAREGIFSQFEVQRGLPIQMLLKHFTQQGLRWKINPKLRDTIEFRKMNLTQNFPAIGQFDIIFCRNVLIYFSETTKRDLLTRLSGVMQADGYLLLGGAETVLGLCNSLAPHATERGLYVKSGSPEANAAFGFRRTARS